MCDDDEKKYNGFTNPHHESSSRNERSDVNIVGQASNYLALHCFDRS
jgi:hypothetical protein